MIIGEYNRTIDNQLIGAEDYINYMQKTGLFGNLNKVILAKTKAGGDVYVFKNGEYEYHEEFDDYYEALDFYELMSNIRKEKQ